VTSECCGGDKTTGPACHRQGRTQASSAAQNPSPSLNFKLEAFAKNQKMAKQKFRPTRPGVFSGAKAYISYVEVLKKRRNAGDTLFHGKSF
jgi:hypothetical protein